MDQEIGKGKLLIAMPKLVDPNFRQAIVFLCEHGPEGSLGLVVNRPTEVDASALVNDLPSLAGAGRIYAGGPVGKNTMLILCRADEANTEPDILEDVFLAKDLDSLKAPGPLGLDGRMRCFLGYAGWAAGQLQEEVEAGAWTLVPGETELIFDPDPTMLWQDMMLRIGGECSMYSSMPRDPSMN
jgi:putative transcriptional regulator